ncbi:MAG TPA: ATP-binding cassette domain-containing protein [Candidatus Limnocylindrales bacterium]|nr:ATP-binding cassette domain-containing protein [Candidatus Limnocylindrales bacterium]
MFGFKKAPIIEIELQNVTKSFEGREILKDISFQVQHGKSLAIVGPPHSGKELLLNLINGASLPDSGRVRVLGIDTRDLKDDADWHKFLENFGLVSQRSLLFNNLTVGVNIALPLKLRIDRLFSEEEIARRVGDLMRKVRLSSEYAIKFPSDLEQEARKRVEVARALAYEPKILLYEEPTLGLDARAARNIGKLIRKINKKMALTAFIVTLDEEFARQVADEILFLDAQTGTLYTPK